MMKHVNLAAFLSVIFLLTSCASMTRPDPSDLSAEYIHKADLTKKEIFNRSQEWISEHFVDSNEVIEVANPDTGTVIGKGRTQVQIMGVTNIPVRFTLRIDIKEGRYRTRYTDWTGMYGQYRNTPQPLTSKSQARQMREEIKRIDEDLFAYLTSSASSSDW